ncbi:MAG: hypothetical protein JO121_23095 [Deltaproteobacteria bacterium]|nr:hypothetical protein [Deltaproteobacteria bacterium]
MDNGDNNPRLPLSEDAVTLAASQWDAARERMSVASKQRAHHAGGGISLSESRVHHFVNSA